MKKKNILKELDSHHSLMNSYLELPAEEEEETETVLSFNYTMPIA